MTRAPGTTALLRLPVLPRGLCGGVATRARRASAAARDGAAADAAVVEVAPSRRSLLGCSTAVELDVVALTAGEEARWRLLKGVPGVLRDEQGAIG